MFVWVLWLSADYVDCIKDISFRMTPGRWAESLTQQLQPLHSPAQEQEVQPQLAVILKNLYGLMFGEGLGALIFVDM
ncbi:hypothetical protein QBC35DRAFT_499709 [Podospora australis]|uniref:Uncharacterized protein n=1 Tax=Podospora australis TaxID=1536484 RepID=A0AAN6WV75_9PEZI|nr:hypothetical protein QBC35DRAFT_499709 [Podospora australis]